ncbi:glycosyltransferase family 39 protein [Legionella antarctica]|nr:glycosyltransferase family 39 protein [Legionella antarctica]
MTSADLLVEEAYYWNYAQHLDFSYLDHPPMVALLIKFSTSVFGTNEFSVRITSLMCWLLTAFFSYKLTHLINRKAAIYALMLLAILPFFFIQSLVITPDLPLLVCWSASLYCLYRSLILNEAYYWYLTGIWLGLGMLSKYTIVLLGLATLYYVITVPTARLWLKRKEPYVCALIAGILFTPVIYWNATHQWASFLFQSKRRFASTSSIDLHYLLALIFIFITPLGVLGLWRLLKKNTLDTSCNMINAKRYLRIFILVPLGFFALFSLNHEINLNWIGPLFLALIPWLALLIANNSRNHSIWLGAAFSLLLCYSCAFMLATFNSSRLVQEKLFIKVVAWESLIRKFHHIAEQVEVQTKKTPIFIPLDNFPISSELAFYQSKFLAKGSVLKSYPIASSHIFGIESLMYRYWSKDIELAGKPVILISKELWRFALPEIKKQAIEQSTLKKIWSKGQGQGVRNIPFYYQVMQMKE